MKMRVEKNEKKSTNSLSQVRTMRSTTFLNRREDELIQVNEEEIDLNLELSDKNASSLSINYVIRSQRKNKS